MAIGRKGRPPVARTAKKNLNILIPIDFSKNSDSAISRAVDIAKTTTANITLLHVVQKKSMDIFLDKTLKKLLPRGIWISTEEYKETLVREKMFALSSYKINMNYAIITKGNPGIKILQYAKKNKINLIVIGAHGKYSIRDTLVGTTAEYIAKHTKCPVLIVKNKPLKNYQKILVPIDFSSVSKKALNYALQINPQSNIRIIHIGDYEYENLLKSEKRIPTSKILKIRKAILFYLENKMKKFLTGYGKKLDKHNYHITLGYPGPIIIKEAGKLKRDLIVMGTRGYGRFHYLFIGSVANRVLTESDKDILLVPP